MSTPYEATVLIAKLTIARGEVAKRVDELSRLREELIEQRQSTAPGSTYRDTVEDAIEQIENILKFVPRRERTDPDRATRTVEIMTAFAQYGKPTEK